MRISSAVFLTAALLSGCATSAPENIQQLTKDFDFADYKITLTLASGEHGCVLGNASLQNKASRPLNYVYTQFMSANAQGATLNALGINFPPTIQNGTAQAVAISGRSKVLGFEPCSDLQMNLSASPG